ncbi:YiiX/YebB-like N1pC/P60 family cysteine hydrolase [Chitiniphilus purpureus]|uniref:YiiX/YebB-like N1pC/P60 family cysteine hydrolase n=1 Tax=Chitiniphilus purpureus TaxID=2981137 RepID=A0ABY6DMT6_9NEIS|nr:YiiX/YebB-like N1pC/P60 family cysteine hydrolase [Chitiniphilus sp. CD1]UXY15684.1 YiiX/YebB-like N1pC/P60 family cysteine hydrolase [Chitiniphilus sp. CD1]
MKGLGRVLLLVLVALAGCATRVEPVSGAAAPAPVRVAFQQPGLSPKDGGALVDAAALLPGDILLSASNGFTSAGIRMFTLAPVSHAALYLGDGEVAEAVGEGVRLRRLDRLVQEEAVVVAFRREGLDAAQIGALRDFAHAQLGQRYDYVGVLLQAPFSVQRRLCELPLVSATLREACLRGVAAIQLGTVDNERFFCSQFVLAAYHAAGAPLTNAHPRWISPADILHMRKDDVPSVRINQALAYIGHLKFLETIELPDARVAVR